LSPGLLGARDAYPQSFSPRTRLVYVPTIEAPGRFGGSPSADGDPSPDAARSYLTAWDPVKQRPVWQQPTPGTHSGGTLATGGDLVFQGQADGYIAAYGAADGRRVWSFYAATAALGTPITFAVGKQQYISILTGPLQGAAAGTGAAAAKLGWDARIHPRRLLTFVLDGKAKLPPTPSPVFASPLDGPGIEVDEALVKEGIQQWARCQLCHGPGAIAGGAAPDLRASQAVLTAASFATAVRGGIESRGMPKFAELSDRELDALRNYVRQRARLVTRPKGLRRRNRRNPLKT
jgi:quinohemoprotein ethanol dehydrogenase